MRRRSIHVTAAMVAATIAAPVHLARADPPSSGDRTSGDVAPAVGGGDDPVSIVVTGSAATSFSSKATEGTRPRESTDAASLLEGLPGVRVRRLGGEGGFATLSIRGAASNQVAISLASVPLTGAADPSLDLATLPLWPGATVRVHRTFAPAYLGGGYLGGIVQVDPVGDASRPRTELYDAVGSFGAYRLRVADVRAPSSGWQLATGISASRTEGDFPYYDRLTGNDRIRTNGGTAQAAALVQARRDTAAWTLLVTAMAQQRRDGIGGAFDRPLSFTRLFRDRQLLAIEGRRGDDDGRLLARVWIRRDGRRFEDPRGEQTFLGGNAEDRSIAFGSAIGRSFRFGESTTLDLRLDQQFETASGVRVTGDSPFRRRTQLGASIDASHRRGDLRVDAAARADLRRDVANDGGNHDEVLPAGHLGAELALSSETSIAAHAGVLARPPSFLELLGDGGVYVAAPDLRSERAMAVDWGVRSSGSSSSSTKGVRFEVEAVLFAALTRDLIVVEAAGYGSLKAVNVGNALSAGAELSSVVAAGPLKTYISYTYLHTEDRTSSPISAGNALPGRPLHDLTADLTLRLHPVTLRYGVDLVSSTFLDRAGTRELPARAWHSVGARLEVPGVRGLTLIGEVLNVFDQRTVQVVGESSTARMVRYPVSDFIGYPLPGRRFTLAARYSL